MNDLHKPVTFAYFRFEVFYFFNETNIMLLYKIQKKAIALNTYRFICYIVFNVSKLLGKIVELFHHDIFDFHICAYSHIMVLVIQTNLPLFLGRIIDVLKNVI